MRMNYAFASKTIQTDGELLKLLKAHNLVDYQVGSLIYIKPAEALQLLGSVEREKDEIKRLKQVESNYSKVKDELEKLKEEYRKAQKECAKLNELYKKVKDELGKKETERGTAP